MKSKRSQFPTFAAYIQASGRTQADVATELGIVPSAMSMILSGRRRPGPELALLIAEKYGVALESLLRPCKRVA